MVTEIKKALTRGTKIFNPQAKIVANADRALQFIKTGNAAPVLIELDPSNTCNHGCYFCISSYIHLPESKNLETYNKSVMPENILLNTCKDFVDMGVRAVNWTGGGEPTINPHLGKAITYLGENNIKMGMFTNGTLLDKWDLFDTIVDNMTWVRFSVDAGTKETYNSIRRARKNQGWDKMTSNLSKLIEVNNNKGKKIDIGVGFVITPDTYTEIVDFANNFKDFDINYCQYKPEVVNREREDGVQRDVEFWNKEVQPKLIEAKNILGKKFQINGYKITDLEKDPSLYGRTYKKCLGSQLSPCVGADGHVYVCPNHRGYKQYSYGSLHEKSFKEIWNDLPTRKSIMNTIDNVECFKNCTKLCKPHESNKMMWYLHENVDNINEQDLLALGEEVRNSITHPEFV
jgi:radical SAM protein with 4Fe4S-binding SPASM domain